MPEPRGLWKYTGRTHDNHYCFYLLVTIPTIGKTILDWRLIPIDKFWGTK